MKKDSAGRLIDFFKKSRPERLIETVSKYINQDDQFFLDGPGPWSFNRDFFGKIQTRSFDRTGRLIETLDTTYTTQSSRLEKKVPPPSHTPQP